MNSGGGNLPPPCGEGQTREAGQGGEPASNYKPKNGTDHRLARAAAFRRARFMRKSLTPHEARLWAWLKTLRSEGVHFRRQAPFRGYFLDFVCFSRRLVIELDGGEHMQDVQFAHDRVRDRVLRREGFRTLRIWNGELDADFDAVSRSILRVLSDSGPPPWPASPACPSPQGGGRM